MKESLTKVDLILALLAETKGRDRTDWLLWAEQNALARPLRLIMHLNSELFEYNIVFDGTFFLSNSMLAKQRLVSDWECPSVRNARSSLHSFTDTLPVLC